MAPRDRPAKDAPASRHCWPASVEPKFYSVPAGIARTSPAYGDYAEVREIEALYLAVIGSARRSVYIETQYLASEKITRALAERLAEPDGPEIILVLPRHAQGWLDQMAMDSARRKMLRILWAADTHGRFGAYYPETERGAAIYLHAKVMVVDDRVLRVGSSNLNNRSLGVDTECDVVLDAETVAPAVRSRIARDILDARQVSMRVSPACPNTKTRGSDRLPRARRP